ncbi:MAG: hypothetical protein KDJ16_17785 [Hyphomicrobiales bacterium]|nr:hypothetical protein [Hyphomicrobiales bacterium]
MSRRYFAAAAVLLIATAISPAANAERYLDMAPVPGGGTTHGIDPKWEWLLSHVRPVRNGPDAGRIPLSIVFADLSRERYRDLDLAQDRGDLYVVHAVNRYGIPVRLKVNAKSGVIVGYRELN